MAKPRAQRRTSEQSRWTRDVVKEKYWRTQIALWQESGLSVRAFCKEHGVVETSFYAWRRELIVRARESGVDDELMEPEKVNPNVLKDGRGRTVSIRFRQTDHRALQSLVEEESASNPFVPLKLVSDPEQSDKTEMVSSLGITLVSPSGYKIKVDCLTDIELLKKYFPCWRKLNAKSATIHKDFCLQPARRHAQELRRPFWFDSNSLRAKSALRASLRLF